MLPCTWFSKVAGGCRTFLFGQFGPVRCKFAARFTSVQGTIIYLSMNLLIRTFILLCLWQILQVDKNQYTLASNVILVLHMFGSKKCHSAHPMAFCRSQCLELLLLNSEYFCHRYTSIYFFCMNWFLCRTLITEPNLNIFCSLSCIFPLAAVHPVPNKWSSTLAPILLDI